MPKKKPAIASLTLRGSAHWPLKKRNAVVKWLKKVAQDLWHDPTNHATTFRARYFDV
jgi:hypothetical protein